MNIRKIFLPAAVAIVLPLTCTTIAHAGGWYIGASATGEYFPAGYDNANASDKIYGLGFLVGYRMSLGKSGLLGSDYFGGELDFTHHSGTVRGSLAGAGSVPGRNEYSESWGQNWSYEKEKSYGFTWKLGWMRPWEWMSDDASLYVLFGFRLADMRFGRGFEGCGTEAACDGLGLASGAFGRDVTQWVIGWMAGTGFEKMLNKHTAFRIEGRLTGYTDNHLSSLQAVVDDSDKLLGFGDVGFGEFGLSLGLIRYF